MPIIESLLDIDYYKLTMNQLFFHQTPNTEAKYVFKCRNKDIDFRPYLKDIQREINNLSMLRFTIDEVNYLATLGYFKQDYLDFLLGFRLNPQLYCNVYCKGKELIITATGPVTQVSPFEIYVLSIVNEIYFRDKNNGEATMEATRRLNEKISLLENTDVKIIEFGTRRRRSLQWQSYVLDRLKRAVRPNLVGTSNVLLAMNTGLKPIGTMAHEFLQMTQALTFLPDAQKYAFDLWLKEYQGELGIVLSDVWGMDAFFADFSKLYAKAYDGARHDSGDPVVWCNKLIKHYESMGIDPKTKSAVFSDSLNIPKAKKLEQKFGKKIKCSYGIGTNLTNDFPGEPALNIVMKMVECNGHPVAKISDAAGKTMSKDAKFLAYLKQVIERKVKTNN